MMIIIIMNHLTQKDIGLLLYIGENEGCSNFLLKDISLFVPNAMVRRINHLSQKYIGCLLIKGEYVGWSNFLLKAIS